jgi:uncharacterized membrane protein HdeD (DUF308 family)
MTPIHVTNWWSLVIRGTVALMLGILVFMSPDVGLDEFVELFAMYVLIDGLVAFAGAMRSVEAGQRTWTLIVEGIAGIIIGFVALTSPLYDLSSVYLMSGWALVTGALEILAGRQLRTYVAGEWLLIASGLSSVALGFVILMIPLAALSVWVGFYAFVFGGLLILLGFRLRPLLGREAANARL